MIISGVNDVAGLCLLNVATGEFGSSGFGEIFCLEKGIGEELGDKADRVGVFIFGKTSHMLVGKIKVFYQAQEDVRMPLCSGYPLDESGYLTINDS